MIQPSKTEFTRWTKKFIFYVDFVQRKFENLVYVTWPKTCIYVCIINEMQDLNFSKKNIVSVLPSILKSYYNPEH